MRSAVIGMGKIGLPLANMMALKGHEVLGYDINRDLIRELQNGIVTRVFEPGLEDSIRELAYKGNLKFTAEIDEAMRDVTNVVVVVPLYVDRDLDPDFRNLDAALRELGGHLAPGCLVTIETTVPVGTTRDRAAKILSAESGLEPGEGFLLAFSPERVSSGTFTRDMSLYPKLVGGINEKSTEAAALFYESFIDFDPRSDLPKPNGVWRLESSESAEFTKLAETTYRDVNIALANNFGRDAKENNLDIWEIIEAANSQPFSHIHSPGISVGGHCIPVYPHLYMESSKNNELISLARSTNKEMPAKAVQEIEIKLGNLSGLRVCILGISYRSGVKESAFSGALDLRDEVQKRDGIVLAMDPLYTEDEIRDLGFTPFEPGSKCDAVILHTPHPMYKTLVPEDFDGLRLVLQGRADSLFGPNEEVEEISLF